MTKDRHEDNASHTTKKSLKKMKLHEILLPEASHLAILKVPGGWIYYQSTDKGYREGVFVPRKRCIIKTPRKMKG